MTVELSVLSVFSVSASTTEDLGLFWGAFLGAYNVNRHVIF